MTKKIKYILYTIFLLLVVISNHLSCIAASYRLDRYCCSIDEEYNYNHGLEYKFYSAFFSGEQVLSIDSTDFCPPYRELYITIKRPFWSSLLSYMTLTIPFRHTIFVLSCK